MQPSFLQRITAWLCLAAAILTGFAPAQGLVLCLEPAGCVEFEAAACASACGGCGEPRDGLQPGATSARGEEQGCCTCVDVELPALSQDRRVQPRVPDFALEPCAAIAPATSSPVPALVAVRAPRPRSEPPRPPETLTAIRSVVLRL